MPGAITTTTYQVVIGFVAAEPIEAFTPGRLNNISVSVADSADVDPSNVNVTASAASTRVNIVITTPTASASTTVEETLSESVFADASAASSFLGLTMTSAPTITSQTIVTVIPPTMSAGLSVPDAGAGAGSTLTLAIAVGAGSLVGGIGLIMLVIRCRKRGKKTGRAGTTRGQSRRNLFGSSRAQVGFGGSSRMSDERGVATSGIALEEDFDFVKAARPVRDLEAERTLDIVKMDKPAVAAFASATFENALDPTKNNLLSTMPNDMTPRAAKSFALNQMIMQATKSSKIKPIPWKDLELLEKLGEGTFGTVHACSFKATPCAVKQLRDDRESSAALLADMLKEHDTMMTLRHPNVVLMLGIATDNVQRVGIVLELLEVSLAEFLHDSSGYVEHRTWRNSLLSIASDVAKGIAYLHFNNLLHRDLKPGNVLLSDSWVAKVADFGSSANAKTSAAGDEAIHGTPPYMSPEVARGENNQTAAVDVWSFGCLLVHMGTLCPPYFALKCKHAMDIVRVVQRGDVSPVQVLLDDTDRREYRCPASIVTLAKQCCHREPTQRPDMAAIAGALASPTIQTGIYKGVRETRPLVRLQRSRASVEGEGTFDASKATYDDSVAAPSARGDAAESARSSPAYNASKSKFQNLSKQVPAGASSTRGEASPRAAPLVGSASESIFNGKAEAASDATFVGKEDAKLASFKRTSDGKAEAPAVKTSICLSARLARASMANMDDGIESLIRVVGNKLQGSHRTGGSSARGALEHATESATCAHDGADHGPLTSERRASTIGSTAAHLPSTVQPVGVNVHQPTSQQTTAGHASSPARGASDTDIIISSTASAAISISPVGGAVAAAPSAASASAVAPSSAAPNSAAAPLGSPAAERTMAQKVARVMEELSLDPSLPVAKAVADANVLMGIKGQGTLAQQVDFLLTELGVL